MSKKALIYKVQDYQESSKLLFVYTDIGKFTLVAKGVKNYKNPYFHLADYLNLIEVNINENKSMQTLRQAELINSYEEIKNNFNDFKTVSKILKVVDRLLVNVDYEDRLFNLIINLLDYENKNLAYLTLLIKLTYSLGYRLTFSNDKIKGFNLKKGKTVNENEDLKLDLDIIETMYLKLIYYKKEEVEISDEIIMKLYDFIKKYYLYHLDYKIE